MSKSYNLETLCLKMNSLWQYIDVKLNGKLSSISTGQKLPEDIISITPELLSTLADKTATIYTVVRNILEIRERGQTTTCKTFFDNYAEPLSPTEKENIYWKIRLRYGCGVLTVAVTRIVCKLRQFGYTNWVLPNGITIPLNDLLLISFHAMPNDLHVSQSITMAGGVIVSDFYESIEIIGKEKGVAVIRHIVLGVTLPSGEKYIIDPTSLQFGIRGKDNQLIYSGSWDEYCAKFPGKIIALSNGWKQNKVEAEMLYKIGNQTFGHIDQIVESVLRNLTEDSCTHCGQIARPEGQYSVQIVLFKCSRCKKSQYCDKVCQKSNWKFHKIDCKVE